MMSRKKKQMSGFCVHTPFVVCSIVLPTRCEASTELREIRRLRGSNVFIVVDEVGKHADGYGMVK